MTRQLNIALIAMPFASTRLPSIQLGLLKSIARSAGHRVTVHYPNIRFARELGWERYEMLCEQDCRLLGEWLFSRAAFGDAAPDAEAYLAQQDVTGACARLGLTVDDLVELREVTIPRFIEAEVGAIDCGSCDLVGFTSMFEQTCAAVAMARAIRERHPQVRTLFGGANFDGEMGPELIRSIDSIGAVIVGEADHVFPCFLEALASGRDPDGLPGVVFRRNGTIVDNGRPARVEEMSALPVPDYDDFFFASSINGAPREIAGKWIFVPFESARGCWWGAKSHCTFCGLNSLGMAYRSKPPERVLEELDVLSSKYGPSPFFAVDNILDHRYIDAVFGELHRRQVDYEFWYEVKANLRPEQIRDLARGGLRWAQPGIESLSTHVLQLMRKGSTSITNIAFLKWAHYYGIRVAWNVLYGFPGETAADYDAQVELMRRIPHLPPPDDHGRIRMDRFSPYFNTPEEWGLGGVRPDPAYGAVYPAGVDHARIAYYFRFDDPNRLPDATYGAMTSVIGRWQEAWSNGSRPSLTYTRGANAIRFADRRDPSRPQHHYFGAIESAAYPFLGHAPATASGVAEHVRSAGIAADAESVDAALARLLDAQLLWSEGERLYALALPANRHR